MAQALISPGAMPADSTVHVKGPRIHTVVPQPAPFCSIDCRYCYLPERGATSTTALAPIIAAFREIFSSGMAATHISVIWHVGESFVLPVFYYRADLILEAMDHLGTGVARIQTRAASPLDAFEKNSAPHPISIPFESEAAPSAVSAFAPSAHSLPLIQIQRGTR